MEFLEYRPRRTGLRRDIVLTHELPEGAAIFFCGSGGFADVSLINRQNTPDIANFKL
jgi:hypothetical protein